MSVSTITLIFFVWFAWIFVSGERVMNECSLNGPYEYKEFGGTLDFTFIPPGYDCVYLNDRGEEVGRVRAPVEGTD